MLAEPPGKMTRLRKSAVPGDLGNAGARKAFVRQQSLRALEPEMVELLLECCTGGSEQSMDIAARNAMGARNGGGIQVRLVASLAQCVAYLLENGSLSGFEHGPGRCRG